MPRRRIIVSPQGGGLKFIDPFNLPQATQGLAYSFNLNYVGVVGAPVFAKQSQTGTNTWNVDPASGAVTGTPGTVEVGDSITVLISDGIGNRDVRTFFIPVGSSLAMVTTSLPAATVGIAYSATMTGSGGTLPYTFPLTGSLPAGITYNATTGVFGGTPTTPVVSSLSISISDAHPTTVGPIAFNLTVNAAITPTVTTAYKWKPAHYAATENVYNQSIALAKQEIDALKAAGALNVFAGFAWGQTWSQLESAATNFNNPANILQQYPGFANFVTVYNYLQTQLPGWSFIPYLNTNYNTQISTPANIATANYGAGFPMPQYIANCGGSLTVPNSYGSASHTTYTVAQARGTSGFYGFGFYGASSTSYSGYMAAMWDPAIVQCWTNLLEAFSLFPWAITAGPFAGQSLTPDANPHIQWTGNQDEMSYTLTAGNYPAGGNVPGFTNNPPLNTTSANNPTPANFKAYRKQWYTKVCGFMPHTMYAGCDSFGFSANGNDTGPLLAGYINDDISGNGLSTIRGLAYSDSDTYGTDWVPSTAANANPCKQGYVGISAAAYPVTSLNPATFPSQVGRMPFIAQIQPGDYAQRLPSGVANNSAAAVNALFAAGQVTNATHYLWSVGAPFGTTALSFLVPAVAAFTQLPTQVIPSNLASATPNIGLHVYDANLDGTGIPPFQNGVTSARGFTDSSGNTYRALDANGWPTSAFNVNLQNNITPQSWQAGTYTCGFTGTGSETVLPTGSGVTITSLVHAVNTTFNLVVPAGVGGCGFSVSAGATNVFAYLPGYTSSTGFASKQATSFFRRFSHLRGMGYSNTNFNGALMTSANRNTPANTKSNKGWAQLNVDFNASLSPGQTSATLASAWTFPTTSYWVGFSAGEYKQVNLTKGSTAAVFPVAIAGAHAATGAITGFEGGPQEWFLQLCVDSGTNAYLNMPVWEDGVNGAAGTYSTAVATSAASMMPAGKTTYVEMGNELWLGVGAGTQCWDNLLYPSSGLTEAQYLGERCYRMALKWQAAYGARFGTDCKIVMAWQAGTPTFFFDALNYIRTTYGAPGQWVHALAIAPYKSRNNSQVPGDGVSHVGDGATVATVESQLTANSNYISWLTFSENIAIIAMHYGMEAISYEGGWEIQGETNINCGTAITDNGMTAVVTNYMQKIRESGYNHFTWLAGDVNSEHGGGNVSPQYGLTESYANLALGLVPRAIGMINANSTAFVPTRNVVSGSGSVISNIPIADNAWNGGTFPTTNRSLAGDASNRAPYYGTNGYIGWLINCTKAGSYSLVVNATGSATTNVEVGNSTGVPATIPLTGKALVTGNNTVGTIALVQGINYVLLGNGSFQSGCTINSLTFN